MSFEREDSEKKFVTLTGGGGKNTQNFKESLTELFQIKQRNFVFSGDRIIKCFNLFFY